MSTNLQPPCIYARDSNCYCLRPHLCRFPLLHERMDEIKTFHSLKILDLFGCRLGDNHEIFLHLTSSSLARYLMFQSERQNVDSSVQGKMSLARLLPLLQQPDRALHWWQQSVRRGPTKIDRTYPDDEEGTGLS